MLCYVISYHSFQKMLDDEPDYLPAILGMASGYMMEKNEVYRYMIYIYLLYYMHEHSITRSIDYYVS